MSLIYKLPTFTALDPLAIFMNIVPVSISKKATSEIKKILDEKQVPSEYGLRVGVNPASGCGAKSFVLGFDKKTERDISFEIDSIPVYVKKADVLYLTGMQVEYVDNEKEKGFSLVKEQPV